MQTSLNALLADALIADRHERAARFRRSRVEAAEIKPDGHAAVTVRLARPDDAELVLRLAQLDNRPVPLGPMLLAEVEGQVLAARSLLTGRAIADPFRHTAHLVELLELRSAHFREGAQNGRPRIWHARAWLRAMLATGRS